MIKAHSTFLDIKAFLLHICASEATTGCCYNLLSILEMELMKTSASIYTQISYYVIILLIQFFCKNNHKFELKECLLIQIFYWHPQIQIKWIALYCMVMTLSKLDHHAYVLRLNRIDGMLSNFFVFFHHMLSNSVSVEIG